MSTASSGVKNHDDACAKSEGARQVAVAAAGSNQAAITAAEVQHYRNVLSSCRLNLGGAGQEAAMTALRSLGVTGA